jgi:BlaI family transcriptional regulator, penicillinase repressor
MKTTSRDLPILTRGESEVMRALWTLGQGTVQDIIDKMGKSVAYTTVLTLVRILERKGYLAHRAQVDGGRAYLYRPTTPPSRVRRHHVRDLVERLFDGRTGSLVVGLLEDEALSRKELEELRDSIDAQLDGDRTRRPR